ncbi:MULTISPECIES: Cof-type HAD-IIB family hydrolase [Bacillus]|uniref:Cof-type HAD-IIB family hydrolase n=1 Tax=Bacillus TaxID=1386 RepID=UPI0002FF9D0E|nr:MULTISPECIES: Cof-type HAD-IIB family hydrolase [Bacillus]
MIKLIATDMDGTFLDDQNQFPKDFYPIYKKLNEQGIIFGAASGRQYYNLVERFNDIKEEMLFIAENGTYVVYKGKELFSNSLNRETAFEIVKLARTIPDVNIVVCGKKSAYIETTEPKVLSEVEKYYARREFVEDLLTVEDDILKIALLDFKGAEHHSMPYFKEYQQQLQVTVGGFIWLDIMNSGSNKGVAMEKIQEYLNISPDQTMVFGDYLNDLEMMKSAYNSYAMANAHEKIKEVARFEAKSNNENGVMETIKERLSLTI